MSLTLEGSFGNVAEIIGPTNWTLRCVVSWGENYSGDIEQTREAELHRSGYQPGYPKDLGSL